MIQLSQLNSNLTNITIYHTFTTITSSFGYEDIDYPSGYTPDNAFVERFEIETTEGWRGGENVTNGGRCFYILMSGKIRLYSYINNTVRMTISKRTATDITL